ncbi:MAG: nitrite/sulfite reductase [Acidimicrobiia bacterium]
MTVTQPDTMVTDPEIAADIERWESMLERYLAGDVDEETFKVFRLTSGVYGQRQAGHNQMLRVKIPYGALRPGQLDVLGHIADEFSRGWGHITTRQNIQFHFVQLERVSEAMRVMGAAGLATREACGDAVRTIQGCHLAGACPFEVLDISPWAEAATRHFIRNPLSQRLPRKFKINFSGCVTDCGQAMFNDVGVIAATRERPDGSIESGFRLFIAGGLGANPHPALALEEFTSREDLLPTLEAALRFFDQSGNRENKLRARMKWLVDTLGIDEIRRRIFAIRRLLPASATFPGGIPDEVLAAGDGAAGGEPAQDATRIENSVPIRIVTTDPYDRWASVNVVRRAGNGTVSAYAHARLGDITGDQFRGLADLQRELDADVRVTNRQNLVLRNLVEDDLPLLYEHLVALDMARPGAELIRDVVACPGADTCNLGVTQSRGLARAIDEALETDGLAEVSGVRINISGCPNSCGQHHVADIGFYGVERRAHGRPAPGYQMLLGGHVGQQQVQFGTRATRLPARSIPEAVTRIVRRFVAERHTDELFREWLARIGGAPVIVEQLSDIITFPTPEESPDHYVDFDEILPFDVKLGEAECL